MKKIIILISILLIIVTGIVTADYFGLFGTRVVQKADFIELHFNTIDEEQGFKLTDVKIRCFRKGTNDACTQRDSGKAGVVSINIPVRLKIVKSWLFEQETSIIPPDDPKLHIMFIHNDYSHTVETLFYDEFFQLAQKYLVVPMPKSIRN